MKKINKKYFKMGIEAPVLVGKSFLVKRFLISSTAGYFPVLNKTQDGKLIVVYRDGDIHVGQRGCLKWSESIDDGESWSRGLDIAEEGMDIRNPAFGITKEGTWVVCYAELDCYENGKWCPGSREKYSLYCKRSFDQGKNWTSPEEINSGKHLFSSPYGKITHGPSDELIMNIYGKAGSYIARSTDDGASWGDYTLIQEDYNETAILTLSTGKMIALLRNSKKETGINIWQSNSTDGGYSWTEPRTVTGKYEHPADLLELNNGDILFTYGHRLAPYGIRAVISKDEGESWDFNQMAVLTADAASSDCGYPSSVQLADGSIYTAYYADSSQGYFKYTDKYEVGLHSAGIRYTSDIFNSKYNKGVSINGKI